MTRDPNEKGIWAQKHYDEGYAACKLEIAEQTCKELDDLIVRVDFLIGDALTNELAELRQDIERVKRLDLWDK